MKKKTAIILTASITGFLLVSVFIFGLTYHFVGTVIKGNGGFFNDKGSYSTLSKSLLQRLPDDELEQAIVDHIWVYKIGEDYDKEYEVAKNLPQGMKYLYSTWVVELEVEDGGFNQFFAAYSTDFTKEAIEGYRFFGADEQADVVIKAVAAHIKKAETDLTELDDEFYDNETRVSELRIKYIRDHIEEFVTK